MGRSHGRLRKVWARVTRPAHGAESEASLRLPFFASSCLFGFLALFGFGVYNLLGGRGVQAALGLSTAGVTALVLFLALRARERGPIYLGGLLLVSLFLLYLMFLGGESSSLGLWIFVIPVIALFLLGRRFGLVVVGFATAGIALIFSGALKGAAVYVPLFRVRFAVTYALICVLSFVYETVRARSAREAAARLAEIKAANTEIARLSVTDPLTGCYNRLYFDDHLMGEIKRCRRYATSLSLVVCDIDHFKEINDTHGHRNGDAVLGAVGALLRNAVREDLDWVVRYGGEEFVIVLPGTDLQGAVVVAERLRLAIGELSLPGAGREMTATASFGVAHVDRPEETTETLFVRADRRLYRAKELGRNQVCAQ